MNKTRRAEEWDCLVVGAGPAGLVAATYLGRYRRRVCVVDSGDSRAAKIPRSRNTPGFPGGISGPNLLQRLRLQAEEAGGVVEKGCVDTLAGKAGRFVATVGARRIVARSVLLAAGTTDLSALAECDAGATWRGLVRWCPVCDGYEALDKQVVLIGEAEHGPAHALFLRTYTRDLTLVVPPAARRVTAAQRRQLAELGIVLHEQKPVKARFATGSGRLWLQDGTVLPFQSLYPMTGGRGRSKLATALGARCDRNGNLKVDARGQTSVPGLYAAGDVVASLKQISVAVAEGAVAATSIHRDLPPNYR